MPGPADQGPGHPDVVLCPDGPMLLRGDHVVQDEDGVAHRTTRPVSAVCRCGASAIKPWCDGNHKALQRGPRRGRADTRGDVPQDDDGASPDAR